MDLAPNRSPHLLVQEFKRFSGLTWEEVGRVFEISKRSAFAWAAGHSGNANNHEKLGRAVATIKFIDRGISDENRHLLLSEAVAGRSCLDLFRAGEFECARELAGKGAGRPDFGQKLTAEAAMRNAPPHFGKSVEACADIDWTEILPIDKPAVRWVKAHRDQGQGQE